MKIPKWDLPNLNKQVLASFLKKVSGDIKNVGGKWFWPIQDIHITKLIFPVRLELFEIDII